MSQARFRHLLTMLTMFTMLALLTICCWPCWPCMSQATFRHLLTMLALFDIAFITTAAISFSLPQLSTYWKVREISKQWWRFGVTILISRCLTLISIILMLLSLRKGLGTPTALPLDDAFHPDVSHWIHLVAVFYLLSLFIFVWFWCSLWPFLTIAFVPKKLNRSAIGISISDCCRQKIVLVCETIVLQKCAKYI